MADPAIAPLSTLQTGDNITSFAVSPYFHISDPSTTCIFHSTYDQPVQCRNVFEPDKVLASYPLFNPMTEEPMRVYCMAFSRDGRHLLCGSSSHIATFDLTRPGEEPVSLFQTAPGRKAQRRHQLALLRGKVSSMSMSADGLLAVGTFARNIGIFADDGTGECITSFSLESDEPGRSDSGVSMVRWCPGGSYLYAAELNSDVIYMYDIRNTGRCLGKLTGRQAKTAQRVDFDIAPRTDVAGNWDGYNIVSGGTDGIVRVWETPHEKEGDIKHTHEWQAHEGKSGRNLLRHPHLTDSSQKPSAVWQSTPGIRCLLQAQVNGVGRMRRSMPARATVTAKPTAVAAVVAAVVARAKHLGQSL